MAHAKELPENWRVGTHGATWTPPSSSPAVATYGSDTDPGDISSHLLREGKYPQNRIDWLRRWTDAGRLHMWGWTIRSVKGVYEHDE